MKMVFKCLLGVGFLAAVGSIVAANFQRDPEFFAFKWKINREAPIEVKLAPAERADIVRTIEAPGKIEADIEVKISSQVMGRIVNLPVKEGDKIKRDDLLVQLDQVHYQAEVRSASARVNRLQSSINVIEADLAKSKRDLERNRRLLNDRAIGQIDVVDVQTALQKDNARLAMAKAELVEAEAALQRANEDLQRTTIKSTITGIVSQLIAKEGEVVVVGTMNNAGTVVMTVSDPGTMVVRARIDENNVPLVKVGQKATVHLQNNDSIRLTGKVMRISPKGSKNGSSAGIQTSATTSTENEVAIFETIISLDNPPPEVRLGMNANVEIQVDERQRVVSIPAQSVLHRRARDLPRTLLQQLEDDYPKGPGVKDPARRYFQVVYVNNDGKARCRLIRTGVSDLNRVEILDGLAEQDIVIAGPYRVFDKLKDGKPIVELQSKDEGSE